MNSVERVKVLCKEQKIPISKLEKDLGYGNGYISGLRKGALPDDRLFQIADYLNVSPEFILTGEEENKPVPISESELTPNVQEALKIFNKASTETQRKMLEMLKLMEE